MHRVSGVFRFSSGTVVSSAGNLCGIFCTVGEFYFSFAEITSSHSETFSVSPVSSYIVTSD